MKTIIMRQTIDVHEGKNFDETRNEKWKATEGYVHESEQVEASL